MIHKLKNITYDLVKMEKALVFQILEQDESWQALDVGNELIFNCSNGYSIRSFLAIKSFLDDCAIIYLRNTWQGKDILNISISNWFRDNEERDQYYNKINQALIEWDNMVEEKKQ